jgi:hypothetical protein
MQGGMLPNDHRLPLPGSRTVRASRDTEIERTPELTEASVAFLLEHRGYPGCTMASLTIRERLEVIERQARSQPASEPTTWAAPTSAPSLDVAWKAAEAALPLAGWATKDGRIAVPTGSWIIGIEYRPESGDGYSEPHYDAAYFARVQVRGPEEKWVTGDDADTPAAALQALAARLTQPADNEAAE